VRLPLAPLPEQCRIVTKIDELFSEIDNGVDSLKSAQQQINAYRQAVLRHAFEGKLTAHWRAQEKCDAQWARRFLEQIRSARAVQYTATARQFPDITSDELAHLPSLPSEWMYVRLSDIAEIGSGMSVSKSRSLDDPIEVPYLRVANVQRGYLDLAKITTMRIERDQLTALRLKQWDVLFNEGGDRDKLGRGWIWESQIDPCITQNHVFRASPYLPSEIHAKFISHWGNIFGQKHFIAEGKQTTNLASINRTVLQKFPVPLPSLEEQGAILNVLDAKLSVAQQLDGEVTAALERADGLKQSILRRAFRGNLVKQNAKDESAVSILDRIRNETAGDPPQSKGRKNGRKAA
jgi:type I restriction enzyme S subunit